MIPTLDLLDFTNGDSAKRTGFVQNLGQAYEEIGFVAIRNHGLDTALQDRLYSAVEAFFALPDDVKMKYDGSAIAGQRGYTSKGQEHAKDANVGDLKEFYHIGQDPSADSPDELANIFPTEVPDFEPATRQAFTSLESAGRSLLQAIALYLGLDTHYFDDKVKGGSSILRPIHYFPIADPSQVPPGAVRAGAHEDINLITLLMGASAEGLEVLNKQGQWVAITALPDSIVVNVGDMLQRLTNNKLRSTTHRVVNPPVERMHLPRYSIPFFMHPRPEMDLSCLPSCVNDQQPKAYPDTTAGQFLHERLVEIGLIK